MTRAETKARARDLWQEVMGSPTWGDEIGIDKELDTVVDELCRRKKVWYGTLKIPVAASQRQVSLKNVLTLDGAFAGQSLRVVGEAMAYRVYSSWSTVAPGNCYMLVNQGQRATLVAPPLTPIVLELFGFLKPTDLWAGEDDENPTPSWSHEAAALGLAAKRARLYPSDEMRVRARDLQERYESEARSLEGEASRAFMAANSLGGRRNG